MSTVQWNSHFTIKAAKELDQGDKIVLPPSALEQLLQRDSSELPSPLTFELRHPHTSATLHCGVKEFSSEDHTALVPDWMQKTLGLDNGDRVLIRLQELPKGTWARLLPISHDYRDITDYRAALEAHLRSHYQTLTKGQILSCPYGARTYEFQVTDLKPQEAVSITDTDLEVDIEHTHTSANEPIGLNQVVQTAVSKGEYNYWKLDIAEPCQSVVLHMHINQGNADIVASDTEKRPTLDNHTWSELSSKEEKQLPLDNISAPTTLYIGIHGYSETTSLSWQASLPKDQSWIPRQEEDTSGKVQCKNCHAWIPPSSLTLHETFCLRNNVLCPWGCGQVFKKGSQELQEHGHCDQCEFISNSQQEQEKHFDYCHTLKTCVCTQFATPSYETLAEHRRTICPEKLIMCRYCHILTAQGVQSLDSRDRLLGLHSHESYCGSRTIVCQKCNKPIPIKDVQVHAKIHEIKRQQQTLPPFCANRNCIRPRATNKNRLGFCQYCFGPFWITEDDPKNTKLIQRIARKLHSQLTVGCGHDWCRNKYCASCNKEPKDATTAASLLIPMIKPLPRELSLPQPNPELHLCVDETTTRKKFLAEFLMETTQHYELGWCVKAIEAEQEDLDRAQAWLDRNAPRK